MRVFYIGFIGLLLWLSASPQVRAQDNCAAAVSIPLGAGNFGLGTFASPLQTLNGATLQPGEFLHNTQVTSGTDKKSVWYTFTVPTARAVNLELKQPGLLIPQDGVGFTLYKDVACVPNATTGPAAILAAKLTPLNKFGSSYNPCLDPGTYRVQVSAKANVLDEIFVELTLDNPNILDQFDFRTTAQNYGTVAGSGYASAYDVGCQTIDDATETCPALTNPAEYTQSTWHTFTADAWIDALRLELGYNSWDALNVPPVAHRRFGVRLYEGAPTGTLTEVLGCTQLQQNSSARPYHDFMCSLTPGTQYTVQVFYHKDAKFTAYMRFWEVGEGNTTGFDPLALPAANQFGVLPTSAAGVTTNRNDNFSCNSRLSNATPPCNATLMPNAGVVFNGRTYDLSTWYTVQIPAGNNLQINAISSCLAPLVRMYYHGSEYLNDCATPNVTLYQQFTGSQTIRCIPAGYYTIQVLGSTGSNFTNCGDSHLGRGVQLRLTATEVQVSNNFDLANPTRINQVNNGDPLPDGISFPTGFDRFGCNNTLLPAGDRCQSNPPVTKAIYRRIVVDQNGYLTVSGGNWVYFRYRLYRGDAAALANAQAVSAFGQTITGLTDQVGCQSLYSAAKVCVTPGVYTLVSFGDTTDVGIGDQPTVRFDLATTQFFNPAAPNNLGTINSAIHAVSSGITDQWSCMDNPLTIAGRVPCGGATKQIYRTFYLDTPRNLSISSNYNARLFSGRITDGIGTLIPYADAYAGDWACFSSRTTHPCAPMPAGWYTVVQYASGGTYASPTYTSGQGGDIGNYVSFGITIVAPPLGPQYNRPAIAAQANSGNPITWFDTGTPAIPLTHKTYTLPTEYFNCVNDLPFAGHPISGCAGFNRTAYYVFTTNQESYMRVHNISSSYRVQIYAGNARTDATILNVAPMQQCISQGVNGSFCTNGNLDVIDICRLQAGTYTMVVFANDTHIGSSLTPVIYLDRTGDSRFDHAASAYDFGVIPANNTAYFGKVDDPLAATPVEIPNPINASYRPSTDFFYCSTGAQPTDPRDTGAEGGPNNKCDIGAQPAGPGANVPYPMTANYSLETPLTQATIDPRRNLWYTFVVDGPGQTWVTVNSRTNGKTEQVPFSVYASDVDGELDFANVVASNLVDSTTAGGLSYVNNSWVWSWVCCAHTNTVTFNRDPCTVTGKTRYYVIVDKRYWTHANQQVDVSLRFNPVPNLPLRYDFCEGNMDPNLNAYEFGNLNTGQHTGGRSFFSCATVDPGDPVPSASCTRTLWYTFETAVSGNVRINYELFPGGVQYSNNEIRLYKATCGDADASTQVPMTSVNIGGQPWGQGCLSPGRYLIMLTGCSYQLQEVEPRVWILPQSGDMCEGPVAGTGATELVLSPSVGGNGSANAATVVDCFTIGESFGEDGSNMGCLFGPDNYKTAWYKVVLNAAEKVDLSFQLAENTSALPNQIRYRVLYGTCGSMSAGPCNSDALTEFTLNCMQGGEYFVQVGLPESATGNIVLTARTTPSPDQLCEPLDPLRPTANFTASAGCRGEAVTFTNYSSQGAEIVYQWSFGDPGNTTSTDLTPSFTYATAGVYTVTLIVTNFITTKADTVSIPVTIYEIPTVNITLNPNATNPANTCPSIIGESPYNFFANATNATAFLWEFGTESTSTDENPVGVEFSQLGSTIVTLYVINGTCTTMVDTCLVVGLEPIFEGGPYDGSHRDFNLECPEQVVYNGGPYDGTHRDFNLECPEQVVYNGGPYDGSHRDFNLECPELVVYNGGPYDGSHRDFNLECPEMIVYNGGPFDGTDRSGVNVLMDPSATAQQLCAGESTELSMVPTTGTPISYLWLPGNATTPTITVSPAATTVYTGRLIFTWPGGCQDTLTQAFIVSVVPGPVANAGADVISCTDTTLVLGSPAVNGLTYTWTPALGLSSTTVAQPTATVTGNITYKVVVEDTLITGSCAKDSAEVTITILPAPTVSIPDYTVCINTTTTVSATVSAGAGYLYYTLNADGSIANTLGTNATYDLGEGLYAVRATNAGCNSDTVRFRVSRIEESALQYRSRQNGVWSSLTTWQVFDPVNLIWVNAESFGTCAVVPYPTSRSLTVDVYHTVTYDLTYNTGAAFSAANNPYGVDETTIHPGAIVNVPLASELAVVDSSASYDLRNNGRLAIEGTFTVVGAGLLENSDPSTVAYTRMGDQTMWNGTYGNLEVTGSGIKLVGGSTTVVRTGVQFIGAHIQLGNRNLTLDNGAGTTGHGLSTGYFITNQFGQVRKTGLGAAAFLFPVGHALGSYNPLLVSNAGTVDMYGVRTGGAFENDLAFAGDELESNAAVNRTWHMSEQIPGGSNLTLTPYWVSPHHNAGFDPTISAIGYFDPGQGWLRQHALRPADGSGNYTSQPALTSMYSHTQSGIATVGAFSVGSCLITPVDYRTIANGNWTDVSIWEVWDDAATAWKPASFVNLSCAQVPYPTALSRYVDVRHDVVLDATIAVGIDQVVIRSTGILRVPTGITLNLAAGSAKPIPELVSTNFPPNAPSVVSNTDIYNLGQIIITGGWSFVGGNALLNNDDASLVHYNGNDQYVIPCKYGRIWLDNATGALSLKRLFAEGTRVNTELEFRMGKLVLGAFSITCAQGANVFGMSQTTGYAVADQDGYFVWEYPTGAGVARLFPIGGEEYSRAQITFDQVTGAGSLRGRLREFKHPTLADPIARFWTIDQGTIAFTGSYTGMFNYQIVDLPYPPSNNAEKLSMVMIGGAYSPAYTQPNNWRLSPQDIVRTHDLDNNLGYIVNDAFSDFTFMPIFESILPVEDLRLAGRWTSDDSRDAQLNWQVSREAQTWGYELERSTDLRAWAAVTFAPATANNGQAASYAHLDNRVQTNAQGLVYYRVRQQDLSGAQRYSNIVVLNTAGGVGNGRNGLISVYPNPVGRGDQLQLMFQLPQEDKLSIEVFDMLGKRLSGQQVILPAGLSLYQLPTAQLAQGTYVVRINGEWATHKRFVVLEK